MVKRPTEAELEAMEHLCVVAVTTGSDPLMFYAWCEDHAWASEEHTPDEEVAWEWCHQHIKDVPLVKHAS